MSCFEDLDHLRRQNKELLRKLSHKTENLQRLKLDYSSKPLGNEARAPVFEPRTLFSSARERTLLIGRKGNSLNVPDVCISVHSVGEISPQVKNTTKTRDGTSHCSTDKDAKYPSEDATCEDLLQERANSRPHPPFPLTGRKKSTAEVHSVSPEDGRRVVGRVGFPPADKELEAVSESEGRHVQPLLGYDWIAGLLDAESSLTERSEQFFSELRVFRQVNKEECVHSGSSWLPGAAELWTSSETDDVTKHERTPDTHQCTFCYRINSRLFSAPLDPQATCPVCKMPKEKHPHSEKQPAFIRVSIPRSTLLPAYRYKAHRRCSFDPSDSLALPSHCLSGWTNISMGTGSEMSSLDLRNSMEIRQNTGAVSSAHLEEQLSSLRSRTSARQRSHQLLDVSRLAPYQYLHLTDTRTKANNCSY